MADLRKTLLGWYDNMTEQTKTIFWLGLSAIFLILFIVLSFSKPESGHVWLLGGFVAAIPVVSNLIKLFYINGTVAKMSSGKEENQFAKKSAHADVSGAAKTFGALGLVMVMGYLLMSFNHRNPAEILEVYEAPVEEEILDISAPPTEQPPPPPPPPPPPEIEVVDDEEETEEPPPPMDEPVDEEKPPPPPPEKPKPKPKPKKKEPKIMRFVAQKPEFPGGRAALKTWLSKNTTYPEQAREFQIEGKVQVEFVVDEQGNVGQYKILRSPHKILSDEAFRVLDKMPKWAPGEHQGQKVKVYYTLPFDFSLD